MILSNHSNNRSRQRENQRPSGTLSRTVHQRHHHVNSRSYQPANTGSPVSLLFRTQFQQNEAAGSSTHCVENLTGQKQSGHSLCNRVVRHQASDRIGNNQPEEEPYPFSQDGSPLGDRRFSHFFRFDLSPAVIRHVIPASQGAAVPFENACIAGFVALIPDAFGKFTVSAILSSRTGFASGAVQFFFVYTFGAAFSAIGFRHRRHLPFHIFYVLSCFRSEYRAGWRWQHYR